MLELHRVCFSYGRRSVIDDVSARLRPGSISVVLGPNGAGKSTLLDLCLGWRTPHSGSVAIGGKDILKQRRDMKTGESSLKPDYQSGQEAYSLT